MKLNWFSSNRKNRKRNGNFQQISSNGLQEYNLRISIISIYSYIKGSSFTFYSRSSAVEQISRTMKIHNANLVKQTDGVGVSEIFFLLGAITWLSEIIITYLDSGVTSFFYALWGIFTYTIHDRNYKLCDVPTVNCGFNSTRHDTELLPTFYLLNIIIRTINGRKLGFYSRPVHNFQ